MGSIDLNKEQWFFAPWFLITSYYLLQCGSMLRHYLYRVAIFNDVYPETICTKSRDNDQLFPHRL